MTRCQRHGAALALIAAVALVGCTDDPEACGVRGGSQACACSDGRSGAQLCLPEGVWGHCECTGPFEGGIAEDDASATPPPGGGSGGSSTGGSGGANGEDDAGSTPMPTTGGSDAPGIDAGAVGDAAVDAGGGAGTGGSGGSGGVDAGNAPSASYAACESSADCGGDACRQTTDLLLGTLGVCAPDCQDAADCPMPAGAYDAAPACESGQCRLDCAALFPLPFPRSCPGGMVCRAEGLLQSCYAN
jgi:hypothetical protein